MKVIDQSPVRADIQSFDKLKAYLNGISQFGWSWKADVKAEETIIASLRQFIDNTYIMVRSVMLEGIDIPIPLILVGPSGIYVLLASGATGVFRAKNDVWMEMNRNSRKYAPVRKNLVARAQLMTRVVDAYLTHHQRMHPPLQTALLLGDAGAHVDSVRSAVRVVLKDGMERFAHSVVQGDVVYKKKDEIQEIVDTLIGNLPVPVEVLAEPAPRKPRKPTPVDKLTKATKKMGWGKRQWVMLGLMVFFEALILIFIFVFIMVAFGL
jgi:hypothetical protein